MRLNFSSNQNLTLFLICNFIVVYKNAGLFQKVWKMIFYTKNGFQWSRFACKEMHSCQADPVGVTLLIGRCRNCRKKDEKTGNKKREKSPFFYCHVN